MISGFEAIEVDHQRQEHTAENAGLDVDQGTGEGAQQDDRLGLAGLPDVADLVEVDESPGDQKEDAGHGRIGQVGGQRAHGDEQEQQQQGGEVGRQRGFRAGLEVHAAAVERAGRGVPGEKTADDIGQPLADEFLVAVDELLGAHGNGPADGHGLGQPQHGDDQGRANCELQGGERQVRVGQGRQTGRKGPHCADPGDTRAQPDIEQTGHQAADDHGHNHERDLGPAALGENTRGQGHQADTEDRPVDTADLQEQLAEDLHQRGAAHDLDAEKVADLAGHDQQGRARGKADDHAVRDEIDQGAHARQSQRQLEHPGEEGQGQDHADVLGRTRFVLRCQHGEDRHRDGRGRAAHQVQAGTEQGGDDGRHHGRIQAVFRRQPGNGGKGHALRQHHQRPGRSGHEVVAQGVPVDHRPPAQEGKEGAYVEGWKVHGLHLFRKRLFQTDRRVRARARASCKTPLPRPIGNQQEFVSLQLALLRCRNLNAGRIGPATCRAASAATG